MKNERKLIIFLLYSKPMKKPNDVWEGVVYYGGSRRICLDISSPFLNEEPEAN